MPLSPSIGSMQCENTSSQVNLTSGRTQWRLPPTFFCGHDYPPPHTHNVTFYGWWVHANSKTGLDGLSSTAHIYTVVSEIASRWKLVSPHALPPLIPHSCFPLLYRFLLEWLDVKVAVVMEQALRLLHHCGVPMEDLDFINCDGKVMHGWGWWEYSKFVLLLWSFGYFTLHCAKHTGQGAVAVAVAVARGGRFLLWICYKSLDRFWQQPHKTRDILDWWASITRSTAVA